MIYQEGFDYIRISAWHMATIKCIYKLHGVDMSAEPHLPWGHTFRCWQRCLLLFASEEEMEKVDEIYNKRGTRAIKKVHTAYREYAEFRGSS